MTIKKMIVSAAALLLAALTLASCTPASEIIPPDTKEQQGIIIPDTDNIDTEFKDYVVCSKSYAFYEGEYNYFFMKILTDVTSTDNDYNINLNKSLKEQYVSGSSTTWFEFFKQLTLEYMKEMLYVYEKATAADEKYSKAADEYIYDYVVPQLEQESGGDPVKYVYDRFEGMVQYQNYLNALAFEYVHELYVSSHTSEISESLSNAEVKEYADSLEGEKDMEKTRNIIRVYVPKGKLKAEELKASFEASDAMTKESLISLANAKGYTYYYESLTSDGDNSIYDWTFNKDRAVGDVGIAEISGEGYYVLFYIEEGEETYLFEARQSLAMKKLNEELASAIEKYTHFKSDEAKLNNINT